MAERRCYVRYRTCVFNYHDVISIRAEQLETNALSCVSAMICPFFIKQKVSVRLVNRIQ